MFILAGSMAYGETVWTIAPGRSSIGFKVKHMVFSEVQGKFNRIEGSVVTLREDLDNARMEAVIPVASIYTGIRDRDQHLHSEDFFHVNAYPNITFRSTAVLKLPEKDRYKIIGDLTIRGVTRMVELTAIIKEKKVLSDGKVRMDFVANGQVNRYDFGLRWNEILETGGALVSDTVEINLNIALLNEGQEGVRQQLVSADSY